MYVLLFCALLFKKLNKFCSQLLSSLCTSSLYIYIYIFFSDLCSVTVPTDHNNDKTPTRCELLRRFSGTFDFGLQQHKSSEILKCADIARKLCIELPYGEHWLNKCSNFNSFYLASTFCFQFFTPCCVLFLLSAFCPSTIIFVDKFTDFKNCFKYYYQALFWWAIL